MDFIIYGFMLVFVVTILIIGFVKKQNVMVLFSGIGVMLLGLILVSGNVQFKTGEVVSYSYVCGCCENNTFNTGQVLSGTCGGVEPTCDFYDGNEASCLSVGCSYNNSLCTGTPTPCESYGSESVCLRYGFCEWTRAANTCTNGSIAVVNAENKTSVYKTYDDDFIGNIKVNYVFGFFMILIGLFFILISALDFLNLKNEREPGEVIDE